MIMKGLISLLLATTTLVTQTYAQTEDSIIACYINTRDGMVKQQAILHENKTYVPLNLFRELKLEIGGNFAVGYLTDSQGRPDTIMIYYNQPIGDGTKSIYYIKRDGDMWYESLPGAASEEINNIQEADIINRNGFNYVPLSVLRNKGIDVVWDSDSKEVTVPGTTNWIPQQVCY
jgi:hypothetical protein